MENTRGQEFFIRPCNVWFPDLEKEIEEKESRYQKRSFHAMLVLLCYFRSEITREQFFLRFFAHEAPEKMLQLDRALYSTIISLCSDYQNKEISDMEFDEQLLRSFRRRPTEDVFSPPFESWDEIKRLISKLEKKRSLPLWLDGFGWLGYLKGNVSRQQYAEIVCGEGDYLCKVLAYGVDSVKEALQGTYSMEVSASMSLRNLCMDYRNKLLSPDEFDHRFLRIAREFCADIPE